MVVILKLVWMLMRGELGEHADGELVSLLWMLQVAMGGENVAEWYGICIGWTMQNREL